MPLQFPGEAPHSRPGYRQELSLAAWQLRAFSQRKPGVNLTAHSFRLSIQAPGEKPHPPTFSRHSSQESSSASEQPAGPAVSLPPAVQRKLFPTPLSPQTMAVCPLPDPPVPGPRLHCPGHTASLAPGFLSLSMSVLLLRDKHSVRLCWCLCNRFIDKPTSFTIPLNFVSKLLYHPWMKFQASLVAFPLILRSQRTSLFWQGVQFSLLIK